MAIKDAVTELVAPIISELGYDLVEVEYKKMHDSMNLTIFIDSAKEGGISLDDTEIVANAIDAPLDELDPTNGAPYILNVSSPGLDRPLKTDLDYKKKVGTMIDVSLYVPVDGSKKHVGTLVSFDNGNIVLAVNGRELQIQLKDVAVAKPYIEF